MTLLKRLESFTLILFCPKDTFLSFDFSKKAEKIGESKKLCTQMTYFYLVFYQVPNSKV